MTFSTAAPRLPAIGSGIALVVLGYALASMGDTAIKWLGEGIPLTEIIFFAALFALLPVAVAAAVSGGRAVLVTRRLPLHGLRAVLTLAGCYCGYYAIGHMPLADFYAAVFTAPLFITALSAPLAGERVDLPRWLAVLVGFAGIVAMVRPGAGMAALGTLGALGGAFFYALSVLLVRRMGGTEKAVTCCLYGYLVTLGLTAPLLLPVFVPPGRVELGTMALCGLANGCSLLCIFAAFRRAPAAVLASFHYTQMLWGVAVGLLVFGEMPDSALAAGGSLVVGSGLYILYRETRRPVHALS